MKKITPLGKGVITGVVVLLATLLLYYAKESTRSALQYIVFIIYALGIFWTLWAHVRSGEYTGKFGDLFNKGFRCFIIVTLMMVTFTGIFSTAHPEFAEMDGNNYRQYLKENEPSRNEREREEMVAKMKKNYTLRLVYSAVFGYLITGTIFTAAGAGLFLLTKR